MRMGLSKRTVIKYKYRHIVYKIYFYIIFLIAFVFFSFVIYRLEHAFINLFTPFAVNIGSDAINYTVADYFSDNDYSYEDFVKLSYGENNTVTSLQTNSSLMNRVKAELSILLQNELDNQKLKSLSIPFGNISDNIIFHGMGPDINIKIKSTELTDLVFNDDFESVGINQVRHKIFIEAYVTISISCANATKSEVIHDIIPVAETVIVGDVPKYFSENGGLQVLTDEKGD